MPAPKNLRVGVASKHPTPHEEETRVAVLKATVEHYISDFARAVKDGVSGKINTLMLHQDAFAAGYDDDEYMLLGMAIKYAGLTGLTVTIMGKNQSTMKDDTPA